MVFTLPDLIAGMRDEIATRAEVYGRRVSFGQMTQDRANEKLAFMAAVLAVLEADDAHRRRVDEAVLPPAPPKPERVPASQSQRIALKAQVKALTELGIPTEEMQARMKRLTDCDSSAALDSAQAAKVIASYEAWADEKSAEQARLDGRVAEANRADTPF